MTKFKTLGAICLAAALAAASPALARGGHAVVVEVSMAAALTSPAVEAVAFMAAASAAPASAPGLRLA